MIGAVVLTVITLRPVQAASPIWAPPALLELIEEGMAENKEIQALVARVESLKEEVSFAGSLDDPRLGISVLNLPTDSLRFDQEAMTQKQLSISQKVPWFGKLGLREQRMVLIARRQEGVLEAKRLELARKIAITYYELGYVGNGLEINKRLTEMVNQLIRVAETRYASGKGLQQDVLEAQVELSKLLDGKISLEQKRRTLQDRINELLNRETFLPVAPLKDLQIPELRLEEKVLHEQALRDNPWLRVRQAEVNQAAAETQLAQKDYWPDMDFKVAYGQRDDSPSGQNRADFLSASVMVNIPLWQKSRQDKKLAATRKNFQAKMNSYQGLIRSIPFRVDALTTDIRDTRENYRLFSDALMLQAEQWAHASMSAYAVGKVEFNTMVNAKIRVLRYELRAKRYLYNLYEKRAELEEVLGGPVPQQ